MNRSTWKFNYSASVILEGCQLQLIHHRDRLEYWNEQRDKAEADLRASGVEFREHEVTGGKQVQAVIDPEKQQWLNTCASKINSHERSVAEYERWAQALSQNTDVELLLDPDDIEFFGL